MPRIAGTSTPKYRKHKATGQAIVTLGGKDRYCGPHGTKASKVEYDRLIREWYAAGGASPDKRDELTVVELCAAFLAHAKDHYSRESNEVANFRTLIKRLRIIWGKTLVNDFGPLKLKAFRETLIELKLSRTNINKAIVRLRHIWKWGVENELVRPELLNALQAVAGLRYGAKAVKETEPVKPVPDAYVDAVLPHCSPQVAAMIGLQRVAGMRSGEVCRMTTGSINTQGSVWTYCPEKHKTKYRGHRRTVYLGPKAQAILREWLRTELEAPLFQPIEAEAWSSPAARGTQDAAELWQQARQQQESEAQESEGQRLQDEQLPACSQVCDRPL